MSTGTDELKYCSRFKWISWFWEEFSNCEFHTQRITMKLISLKYKEIEVIGDMGLD